MLFRRSIVLLAGALLSFNNFASTALADSALPKLTVTPAEDNSVEIKISLDRKSGRNARYVELQRARLGSKDFATIARFDRPKQNQFYTDRPGVGELYDYRVNLVSRGKKLARSKVRTAEVADFRAQNQVARGSSAPIKLHPEGQIAYLLVTYRDRPEPPYTPEYAATNLQDFTDYFAENSYGRNLSQGKVFGWYRLDVDSRTYCGFRTGLAEDAVKAADKDVDFNVYDWIVIIVDNPPCGPSAAHAFPVEIKTKEGEKRLFFGYWGNTFPSVHELLHDLSFAHAGVLYCGNEQIKADLTQCEDRLYTYGDIFDPMGEGRGGSAHINAPHKNRLGFFTDSEVITVSQAGEFTLEPLELRESSVKALKVMHPVYGAQGAVSFWVEFRQPLLGDSYHPANLLDGAMIRVPWGLSTSYSNVGPDTDIIDCTPVEPRGAKKSDVVCRVGKTMYDPGTKISITTTALTPASGGRPAQLKVRVDYGTQPPPPSAVTVTSLSPAGGNPGTTVTVAGTGFRTTGNTVRFGQTDIGGIASADGTTLQFTVPTNASSGSYAITVQNSNGTSSALNFTVGTVRQTVKCPSPALNQDLELNMTNLETGGQVTALQDFLWQYQYIYTKWRLTKMDKVDFVTGTYNKKTKAIVKKFQSQFKFLPRGSKEGGKVQAATRAAIAAQCSN